MDLNKEEFAKLFNIFKQECKEHIQNLNDGLLSLENNPNQPALLDEVFRETHSLKGAGRMMGFSKIEAISHGMETILDKLRKGNIQWDTKILDSIYLGIDSINKAVDVLGKGKSEDDINTEKIISRLSRISELGMDAFKETKGQKKDEKKERQWERRRKRPKDEVKFGRRISDKLIINTIRVATSKLDTLMNQVGELLLVKTRSDQRSVDLQAIVDFIDDWCRQIKKTKSSLMRQRGKSYIGCSRNGLLLKEETNINIDILKKNSDFLQQLQNRVMAFSNVFNMGNQQMSLIVDNLQSTIMNLRMLPVYTAVEIFPRMLRDLSSKQGKKIKFELRGGDTEIDRMILEEMKDPLMHLITNCFEHGIEKPEERNAAGKQEEATITLTAYQRGSQIILEIEDDGAGIDTDRIKAVALKKGIISEKDLPDMTEQQIWNFIFQSGFSTSKILTNTSGRGIGMDVVRNNIEKLKGMIDIKSNRGKGTKFIITLPLTLATVHIVLIEVAGSIFAIPASAVLMTQVILPEEIFTIEGKKAIRYKDIPIPLISMQRVLNIPDDNHTSEDTLSFVMILGSAEKKVAFSVDRFIGEQETVLRNMGGHLKRVKNISGAMVLSDGSVAPVLNPGDLILSANSQYSCLVSETKMERIQTAKNSVLLVDDSITSRTLEKNILEAAGFEVEIAIDGLDALQKIQSGDFDIVVTDVEMPHMDGIALTERIKHDLKYNNIPVILVTSLDSMEDIRRGVDVGADAYITKGSFDQGNLIETIHRLL